MKLSALPQPLPKVEHDLPYNSVYSQKCRNVQRPLRFSSLLWTVATMDWMVYVFGIGPDLMKNEILMRYFRSFLVLF